MSLDFLSAFFIGILGAGHCIGMCGGISTMLTTTLPQQKHKSRYIFAYNLGRISSYTLLGAIVGLTGTLAAKSLGLPIVALKIIAGVFLILLGLYIGQWFMGLTHVEKIGQHVWNKLQPLSKKLLPVKTLKQSFLLGALWGWLPCGLVYSTLTWALATHSSLHGALLMFAFGLGTLPALLASAYGALSLKHIMQKTWVRQLIALGLIIYGIITLKFAYQLMI